MDEPVEITNNAQRQPSPERAALRLTLPRGIRNNNPGNLERGTAWRGLAADQSGDARFCVFAGPVWGIRALMRVLLTYKRRHGLDCCRHIANRWAPPHENDTGAYARFLARRMGVGEYDRLDVEDPATLIRLAQAICVMECGHAPPPLTPLWYPEPCWAEAAELALDRRSEPSAHWALFV